MISNTKYKLYKSQVFKNIEIAPQTYLLSFKRTFEFIPGQVIALSIDEKLSPRLYSIASGNNDKYVDVLYDIKSEGKLTPKLSILQVGETIFYSMPFGEFTDDDGSSTWVATGTGIAPFVSMIKSGLHKNKKLIHGARTKELFYFESLFKEFLGENYFMCCSQCKEEQVFYGRLTLFLREYKKLSLGEKFYLCGNAEMVVDVRDILIEKGVPFNSIISEIYF